MGRQRSGNGFQECATNDFYREFWLFCVGAMIPIFKINKLSFTELSIKFN